MNYNLNLHELELDYPLDDDDVDFGNLFDHMTMNDADGVNDDFGCASNRSHPQLDGAVVAVEQ